jgi:hypothetical protein
MTPAKGREESKMSTNDEPYVPDVELLVNSLYAASVSAAFLAAQDMLKSMTVASSQAMLSAVRHNSLAASMELATAATSTAKILGDPAPTVRTRTTRTIDTLPPGAPVVT